MDEICREGARRMLAAALEAEADGYVEALADQVDENGHRLVVRNGHANERTVTTVAGGIEIRAPRINDQRVDPVTGERQGFKSSIVPPWCRKSPKVTEVLPLLYLHGMSSGDFVPALEGFFGSAAGLSASVITRLTTQWQDEQRAFMNQSLADRDFVYVWVDGVHFNIRLEEDRLCVLVIVGVRLDGTKELVAIRDGYRESKESWADLLRDLKRRGMRAPVLAVGDGALGFWAAVRDVWPETRHQRDWFHKTANVLDALPKSAQPTAKKMLTEIRDAEDRDHAARRRQELRGRVQRQVAQGRREDHRRPRRAVDVLRLPRRTLDPPQDHQPDRVDIRDRAAPHPRDQGTGIARCRTRDGLQAHPRRARPLARDQRTAPRRARPRRRDLQERSTHREHERGRRVTNEPDPQVLTIAQIVTSPAR